MSDLPTADHLILSVRRGDAAALQTLYQRFAPSAFAVVRRILPRQADAEDTVQETFLQVWQQAEAFEPRRASVKGWILMIARSRALDRARRVAVLMRREARLDAVEHVLPAPPDDACARMQNREQATAVHRQLDVLPPGQRIAMDLSFQEGLSHTEIATILSMPLGTVKTKLRDAVQRIRGGINGRAASPKPHEPSPFTSALAQFLTSQPRHLKNGVCLRGRHVLLVDDDADTVALVRAILRAAGATVSSARSSREALDYLATNWPDIVLADIVMPSTDGYAFVRQARALAETSGRRLVAAAFTALGTPATSEALAAGFSTLIAKPVQPEALLDTLAVLDGGG